MTASSARARASLEELGRLRDRGAAVELIDGEIVHRAMARPEHGSAQMKLGGLLDGFNRGSGGPRGPGGWWLMTEVDVLYEKTDEVFRHDVLGFRRESCPARPAGVPVTVRPDWVCEVLSASTARYDLVKKHRTLHRHGVPHYWIVDPEHETLTVQRWHADGYVTAITGAAGDVIRAEPFAAVELDVGELFGHGG